MEWSITVVISLIACMIAAYLIGSVNFAIIITKVIANDDIRNHGSGNAGMTNVLRTLGKGPAALTLLGDFSKGIISVIIARIVFTFICGQPDFMVGDYLVAFAALLGHLFPIYYNFKGGKGILVSAGAVLILSPWALLILLIMFVVVTAISKYVSLGSISVALFLPICIIILTAINGSINWTEVLMSLPIAFLIVFMHRQNIGRLIKGNENKISFKSKKV